MNKFEYNNQMIFHPGYYIKDLIEELEMTQEEFAKRLNVTPKNLSDLLNGKASISETIAKNLSLMLGTGVDVWLNLQMNYEQKLIEQRIHEAQQKEESSLKDIDFQYFVNLGLLQPQNEKRQKVLALFKYFSISSFDVMKQPDFLVQFRLQSKANELTILNSNILVQTIINIGRNIKTEPFSLRKLKKHLSSIREMQFESPETFLPRLEKILNECGVAFVLLPSYPKSGVYGVVKWLNKNKVILGMTDRGKYSDVFWFSFAHELAHVMQKRIKKTFIAYNEIEIIENFEEEANNFARDFLIPSEKYEVFKTINSIEQNDILEFAKLINAHPGIVVGRLQKDKIIEYNQYNKLKTRYQFSFDNYKNEKSVN